MTRRDASYVGIRTTTPFRGMLKVRDQLMAQLDEWIQDHDLPGGEPTFMRLRVVDMAGEMDIEVGTAIDDQDLLETAAEDDVVDAGVMPEGRYVTLTYRDHSLRANKALLEWASEQGHELDQWDSPGGDHFACRYERYLTDRRQEPRKTRWEVELGIRLADQAAPTVPGAE